MSYDEALDEALCYGWIDGQLMSFDDKSWLRKFTPRRAKSLWSKRNIAHIKRLLKAGKMKQSGLLEVQVAKADGRWKRAYDPGRSTAPPEDFLRRLARDAKARTFFTTLRKTDIYAIGWRLQTAKTAEIREKRLKTILAMLAKGRRFHG